MTKLHRVSRRCLAFFLSLVTVCSAFLTLCSCRKEEETVTRISVGITEQNRAAMEALTSDFQAKNSLIRIDLHVFATEAEKNYYLSHGADDCDMYTFEEAVSANLYREILRPLDRYNCTNRYMVSVINYLRATDGALYVLPADGFFYTQGYNADLMREKGFSTPTTLSEMKLLASRLKYSTTEEMSSSCATVGGWESVMFSLMSVAYPLFLNTVAGANALGGLATGTVDFLDSEYATQWRNVFENLQVLYDEKFFSLSDLDSTHADGIHRFNAGDVVAIQNAAVKNEEDRISSSLSVKYTPFVGEEARDACFGSMPAFYLSAAATSEADENKNAAVSAFLDYFATGDAQKLARSSDCNLYLSYLKTSAAELPAEYADLQRLVREGNMFVVDSFYYTFRDCTGDMVDFLSGKINVGLMMYNIDRKLKEKRDVAEAAVATIRESYPLDAEKAYREDTALGTFFVNAFTYADYVDGVLLPSSMLRTSLLKGTLTEGEISTVFDERELVFAELSAGEFLTLYRAVGETCHPLTAKLSVRDGALYDEKGQALPESRRLYVILPSALFADLGADADIGAAFSSTERLIDYFRNHY